MRRLKLMLASGILLFGGAALAQAPGTVAGPPAPGLDRSPAAAPAAAPVAAPGAVAPVGAAPAAAPVALPGGVMYAISQNSQLVVTCTGAQPLTQVRCKFVEVGFEVPHPATVRQQAIDALGELMKRDQFSLAGIQKGCSDKKADLPREATVEQKKAFAAMKTSRDAVCNCSDLDCAREAFVKMTEEDRRACRVRTQSWDLIMQKTGGLTWTSNQGPKGPCGIVEVATLKGDPTDPQRWGYTHVQIQSGEVTALCASKNVPTSTEEWSTSGGTGGMLMPECRAIKLTQ